MSLWNGKYVSVQNIIEKAYRDLGMGEAIKFGDAVEWAGEAIELIGSPMQLSEKVVQITVKDYRGSIPLDLHLINTLHGTTDIGSKVNSFYPMRYSTDSFHHYYCKDSNDYCCDSSLTYKLNDNFIFTSFNEGTLNLSYQAIPTDSSGFPTIPDDIKFREAVAGHIKWKLAFIKWIKGEMAQAVFQKIEQERDWYIGAAQTRGHMPSVDMMESLKNNWIRLIPKINQHAEGFRGIGRPEQRYTHNSSLGGRGSSQSDSKDSSNTFFHYRDSGNCEDCGEDTNCNCGK